MGRPGLRKNAVSSIRSSDWIPHSKPTLTEADAAAVGDAVRAGYVGSGPLVETFEAQVARRLDRSFSRATTTGSAALHLALLAAGVRPGDPVLLPAFVCRAVLNVVLACGGRPVLIDIDPMTLCITADAARSACTRAGIARSPSVALVLVHSFGVAVDVDDFQSLGLKIIEDAASSFGASFDGRPVGSSGIISVLSFASTKMMTTGQGGMILTSNEDCAERIDALMDYDCASKPSHGDQQIAYNYGLAEVPASLGISQLSRLDDFVARRREIAGRYVEALRGLTGVTLPRATDGHGYYRFILLSDDAQNVVQRLRAADIDARSSVSHFLHDYLDSPGQFPDCEAIRSRIVSLPIFPSLTAGEVERVASSARDAIQAT